MLCALLFLFRERGSFLQNHTNHYEADLYIYLRTRYTIIAEKEKV